MKSEKIFTVLVILYPLLNRYESIISSVTVSDFLMIILLLFLIIINRGKIIINRIVIPILLFLLLYLIAQFIYIDQESISKILKISRLILVYFTISLISKKTFDFEFAIKTIRVISLFLSIYLVLQFIAINLFSVRLTTYLPFFKILGDINIDVLVDNKVEKGLLFRPSSFFNEPAVFVIYIFIPLILEIVHNFKSKYLVMGIHSLAILLSYSSIGIIILFLIYLYYFGYHFFKATVDSKRGYMILVVLWILLFIFIFNYTPMGEYLRMKLSLGDREIFAVSRFSFIENFFNEDWSILKILFGNGLVEQTYYIPGVFRIFYSFGLIGIVLFISFYKFYILSSSSKFKPLIYSFVILNFVSDIVLADLALYYCSFILGSLAYEKEIINEL